MLRVIKVGGSLLNQSDLAARIYRWLAQQPHASNILVVGGGELVEAIRNLDRIHTFDREKTHWLCIELMNHTSRLLHWLMPTAVVPESIAEMQQFIAAGAHDRPAIVSPSIYLSLLQDDDTLPCSWQTTSDTIAAWLAAQISADELVLLKSAAPPESCSISNDKSAYYQSLADSGYVDSAFPRIAATLSSVRFVNLAD